MKMIKRQKGRWGNWVFPQGGSIETARFQGAERTEHIKRYVLGPAAGWKSGATFLSF